MQREYINEYGGLTRIMDVIPIMQIGKDEPIGYFDKMGNWYPVEQPVQPQYENALVEYEQC